MSINKKNIKVILLGLLILLSLSMISSCSAADNNTAVKVPIKVNEFGFSREPLPFNNDLYGYIDAIDFLGNYHTYYVNDEQMAGLYYASNNTFDYRDGLTVTYHIDGDDLVVGNFVIDHIYLPNGTEIEQVTSMERDEFVNNSVEIGKQCNFCEEYFGLTTSELAYA